MAYPLHPACAIWPKMTDAELTEPGGLVERIKAKDGLILPVTLYEGQLLDGKNR
jgi:hypothetical protein